MTGLFSRKPKPAPKPKPVSAFDAQVKAKNRADKDVEERFQNAGDQVREMAESYYEAGYEVTDPKKRNELMAVGKSWLLSIEKTFKLQGSGKNGTGFVDIMQQVNYGTDQVLNHSGWSNGQKLDWQRRFNVVAGRLNKAANS